MEDELEVGPVGAPVLAGVGSVEGVSTGCEVPDPPEEPGTG